MPFVFLVSGKAVKTGTSNFLECTTGYIAGCEFGQIFKIFFESFQLNQTDMKVISIVFCVLSIPLALINTLKYALNAIS